MAAPSTNTLARTLWLRGMLGALFVSNAGTFLQFTAQGWLVWQRTHSASDLGLLGLVQATPLLGMPLLGGALADRWPLRTLLLLTQATLALLAAGMALLAYRDSLPLATLLVLAGALATVAALDNPVRQVYLPSVVASEMRARVVGLNALSYNGGAVAGPALAGILLPTAGVWPCLLLNALSYLVVLGWLIAGPAGHPAGGHVGGLRWALAYAWRDPRARGFLLLVALVSLLGRSYPQILPALVGHTWRGTAVAYGALAAVPGIGALAAAAGATWLLGRRDAARYGYLGGALLGGAIVVVGLAPGLVVAGGALLATGLLATGTMTLLNAGLQLGTPDGVRGRVLSLYTVLAAGMPMVGGWALGTLMAPDPRLALVAAGAILASLAIVLSRLAQGPIGVCS